MPTRRSRFGSFPARGRVKRETLWIGGPDADVAITLGVNASTLLSSLNAAALALRPFTIVRVRGIIAIRSDQAAAIEDPAGAWGLAVVSEQASGIGITAVPTPVTNVSSDLWFAFQFFADSRLFLTSGGQGAQLFTIDSKAMRKVEDGEDIVEVAENGSASAGMAFNIKWRLLVKLH